MSRIKKMLFLVLAVLVVAAVPALPQDNGEDERAAELERVRKLADELLETVATVTGLEQKSEVNIEITDKAGLRVFLVKLFDEEYPGDELERQSRMLGMLGLLPVDYDLRQGLIDILQEQAAAFYDPRTKTFYSIIDLPEALKVPMFERIMVAHELTHALQDQRIDLLALSKALKDHPDRAFALAALTEGMASIAMMMAVNGPQSVKAIDLGKMLRMSVSFGGSDPNMKVFYSSPKYLQESLFSPYAEGASFVQAFMKEYPDRPIGELLDSLPSSSEQIFHYNKFVEKDEPTPVDLSAAEGALPAGWQPVYSGDLGELEIKVLCQLSEDLKGSAIEIAEGWDGIRVSTFVNGDKIILFGSSVWDSEKDAVEFADAFTGLMEARHGAENTLVIPSGVKVDFVLGLKHGDLRTLLMSKLVSTQKVH